MMVFISFLSQEVDTWMDDSDDSEIFGKFVAFLTEDLFAEDDLFYHQYDVYEYISGNGVLDECLDYSVIE